MSSTANKQPIEVGILEISSQNRAILEFFFSGAGKSYFKEVSLDKASAYIIDYDSLGAKESWESTFEETKKPGIIISIREVDLPSTIWLPKPLTVKELKDAGESIRKMMLSEVSPEPIATIIEDKEIAVKEEFIEPTIIEPQEKLIQEKTPEFDTLFTEDIIDIPSEPLAPIAHQEDILEELNIVAEVQDTKNDAVTQEITLDFDDELISLIEETAEAPAENLLAVGTEGHTNTIGAVSLIKEKPELAIADTKDSASSSSFAASSDFIDIDLSLNDIDENLDNGTTEKSSTTPIDKPVILNTDEESEIDSLLETLISGGKSNEKVDKLSKNMADEGSANLAKFETKELETVKLETEVITEAEEKSDLPEPIITDTEVFEEDDNNEAEISKLAHEDAEEEEKKTAEDELQSLLEEIRQEADGTTTEGNSQIVNKYAPTNAEERWKLICGDNNSADLQKMGFFIPSNHLLTPLIESIRIAAKTKKVTRMKFNRVIVVIDPETDRIYCDQSIFSEFYANICYEPISLEKIKVHQLDSSEIRLYRKTMGENTELTHYTESFIWTTSLLTSRGRLPKNTNMKNKVGLTSWPNLTRVENIPHMMQIAALLHKNTWSLSELINKSGIQKNYITAFYNASLALNVIQTDGDVTDSIPLDLKTSNNKNRSFLSRFLKKLTA